MQTVFFIFQFRRIWAASLPGCTTSVLSNEKCFSCDRLGLKSVMYLCKSALVFCFTELFTVNTITHGQHNQYGHVKG